MQRVLDFFSSIASRHPTAFPERSGPEHEVLSLLAEGAAAPVLPVALYLSPKTVRNRVPDIFTAFQAAGRAQAIIRARDAGLGTAEPWT